MSSQHMSASQRRIAQLEGQLERYLTMEKEFTAFLNIMIAMHGENGELFVTADRLRNTKLKIVRSERIKHPVLGDCMVFKALDGTDTPPEPEPSRIIIP
jgi:hypothetical protein